ncbi:MAG TPA: hypothetical protein PLH97_11005 [Verrucomicrobiota bacterium]|nr:hypothetical protein [Verrucomicrobiota bacterium]
MKKFAQVQNLTSMGQIIPVQTLGIPTARAEAFLTRMAKGMLTHFYPEYDYSENIFEVSVPAPIGEHRDVVRELSTIGIRDERWTGVLDFHHGISVKERLGFWIFVFYSEACCVVTHRHKSVGRAQS